MSNFNNINNLNDLLNRVQNFTSPILINLSGRVGNENYLLDQIVEKVKAVNEENLEYQKLNPTLSQHLKEELMITKNPVLLLIQQGEIKAIFSGLVSKYQLLSALQNLNSEIK